MHIIHVLRDPITLHRAQKFLLLLSSIKIHYHVTLRLSIATFTTAYCRGALSQTAEGKGAGGGGGMADQRLQVHGRELLQVSEWTYM